MSQPSADARIPEALVRIEVMWKVYVESGKVWERSLNRRATVGQLSRNCLLTVA